MDPFEEPAAEEDEEERLSCQGLALLSRAVRGARVNPTPIEYWGTDPLLRQCFMGTSGIATSPDGSAQVTYRCSAHAAIVADPETFAAARDRDKITGVHGCAMNGYADTLIVLVEEGGAKPFIKSRNGIDALMMARRRGHKSVLDYLESLQADGGRKYQAIKDKLEERRLARLAAMQPETESEPEIDEEEARARRRARALEAREAAHAATMAAMRKTKGVERLPRVRWCSEMIQKDTERGYGFYPRKPFAEQI